MNTHASSQRKFQSLENRGGLLPIVGKLALAAALLVTAPLRAEDKPIQCANLIYGGLHTSRCFSDEFLSAAQKQTTVATERRFKAVKLDSDELFQYPFVLITGEADFMFTAKERENLKKYCENGGFLLASAGCSSKSFDRAFRREIKAIFGEDALKDIAMDHPIFRTVTEVKELKLHHPDPGAKLMGMEKKGKMVMVYSPHGLNDTEHSEGCCCCGGNEISNSLEINVNILVYALCH